jgi:hypothetical protein
MLNVTANAIELLGRIVPLFVHLSATAPMAWAIARRGELKSLVASTPRRCYSDDVAGAIAHNLSSACHSSERPGALTGYDNNMYLWSPETQASRAVCPSATVLNDSNRIFSILRMGNLIAT